VTRIMDKKMIPILFMAFSSFNISEQLYSCAVS